MNTFELEVISIAVQKREVREDSETLIQTRTITNYDDGSMVVGEWGTIDSVPRGT